MEEQAPDQAAATAPRKPAPPADLSREIEGAVPREPRDRVRCVRVFGDRYRCNWWAPADDEMPNGMAEWAVTAMHRVRRSRFLRATGRGGRLVIEDLGGDRGAIATIETERNAHASV
jgi:hypothetical protein